MEENWKDLVSKIKFMGKKLYWQIESNEDTSMTVINLSICQTIIEADIEGRPQSELEELQFTITPIFLTEDEYSELYLRS